jgi:hydroxymethylbilane synthase
VSGSRELKLGTRGSQLALWQAHAVAARIQAEGGPPCRMIVIKTSGDRLQDAPLSDVGGKRLFVKEIEDALLRGQIDLAVHSSKDMPVQLPNGLTIAGVLPREDPQDAVVLPQGAAFSDPGPLGAIDDLVAVLGQSPTFGTGSVRRMAQLVRLFSGARFAPIRGNLETRLRKLDEGQHDALVLAAAGLRRLGFASRISFALPTTACVPAPGQGIVAIETREDDRIVRTAIDRMTDRRTAAALTAERAVVSRLGGGCQTPVGALATVQSDDTLELAAIVVALDGSRAVRANARGRMSDAESVGLQVGGELIEGGADDILAAARGAHGAVEGIQP